MPQSPLNPQDFLNVAKQAMQYYKEHKPELQAQVVKDRKKNFKGSLVALLVVLFFLGVGFWAKGKMFFVYWYIWMVFAGIIGLVSLLSIFWNLWLIIRERGKK